MTDVALIVAEMRAVELRDALQAAVNGDAHWRPNAARLLSQIANHELPEAAVAALREVDARKRAAEILTDACQTDVY